MNKDSQKRDYFWNTLGVLFQNGTTTLLLIAITRINGIAASGLFSYASAVAVVLFAFGLWGGRLYQVSDTKREFDNRSYITTRILLAIVMVLAAVVFSFANHYDTNKSIVIIVLALGKGVESIADSIYGVLQVHNGLSYAGKSLIYKAVAGIMLFLAINLVSGSILWGSVGLVFANIMFVLLYDVRLAKKYEDLRVGFSSLRPRIHDALIILKRTSAVFAVTFLATFSINIPRFFVDKYDGSQIAYFGIIAMPITIIALVMSFIMQPNIMQITKMYHDYQYDNFKKITIKIMKVTFSFGLLALVGIFILGVPVLSGIFRMDFSQHKLDLMIMTAGGIANAFVSIFITLLTVMRRFKIQFYTLLFSNIALLVVSGFLIQSWGMIAGVSLFALTNLVQVFVLISAYSAILNKKKSLH